MRSSTRLFLAAACLAVAVPILCLAADPPAAGHWEGAVELPGQPLGIKVDLVPGADGGAWTGAIDIPMQGAHGLRLEQIAVAGDSVTFAIAGIPGAPTFRGVLAEGALAGDFTQNGMTFPFRLGREVAAAPERPQEPKPPFPYRAENVSYDNGDIYLAATLTLPEGAGPFPAAVLITGSGPQNRDEELFGHKPFAVLADALTRRGIAVLRTDDRGVGGSTGRVRTSTTEDFAGDVLAGVRYLQTRPEIDRAAIGLVGHSEGGIIAPMVAARAPGDVAFVVMLAGTGVPLADVVALQVALITAASGADSASVAAEVATNRMVVEMVQAGADSAAIVAAVSRDIRERAEAAGQPLTDDEATAVGAASVRGVFTPWFRFAIGLDPRIALRQVTCPVLALNGELDLQVDADQNLPEIEAALAAAGNRDVTLHRLPGLNHLFQTAATGSPSEYASITETMSPAVLDLVGDWITARFPSPRQD